MGRVFNQKNVWGSQGGINPQRSDFWLVDFTQVINGINGQIYEGDIETDIQPLPGRVEPYYIASVSMPTMKVKGEEVKRDSKPFWMPSYDEAMTEIKVVFILDTPTNATTSKVYQFLDTWRAFVRAGRGAMGNEKTVSLNSNFTISFRFPVAITLLRGSDNLRVNPTSGMVNPDYAPAIAQLKAELDTNPNLDEEQKQERIQQLIGSAGIYSVYNPVENDLIDCAIFQVENMWLSSFKATDLDYSKGNEVVRLEANFYADNFRDLNQR